MIYLFINRIACNDVYHHLYQSMSNAHTCMRLINPSLNTLRNIRNNDITLITSDHINAKYDNDLNTLEMIDYLKPKKLFCGIHDIGDATYDGTKWIGPSNICESLTGTQFILLLPGEPWISLYSHIGLQSYNVGHGKFVNTKTNGINTVFIVSLIYIYADRPIESFYNDYKKIIDSKIPLKFPDFPQSDVIISKLAKYNPVIIDKTVDTFQIISQSANVITNSSSSAGIEAAMCGCRVLNIGWNYPPVYGKFSIYSVYGSIPGLSGYIYNYSDFNKSSNKFMSEYMFNTNLATNIIVNS